MLDGTIPEKASTSIILAWYRRKPARLARLVQNMLDITKLESGEVKGTPKITISGHRYGRGAFG